MSLARRTQRESHIETENSDISDIPEPVSGNWEREKILIV